MKFNVTRKLTDKVFSSIVKFESYGVVASINSDEDDEIVSMSITAEEEKALFEDLGYPVIEIGGSYVGYVKIPNRDSAEKATLVDKTSAVQSDSPETLKEGYTKIEFVRNVEKYTLDENFEVRYSSNAKKLEDEEDGLKAVEISELKCLIFENSVEEKIKEALKTIRQDQTKFEQVNPAKTFSY